MVKISKHLKSMDNNEEEVVDENRKSPFKQYMDNMKRSHTNMRGAEYRGKSYRKQVEYTPIKDR